MQYAKRKIISIAIIAGLMSGNAEAFPAIDYPSVPVAVQENLQKVKVYGETIYLYKTEMQQFLDQTVGKMSLSAMITQTDIVKSLGLAEDNKNLRTKEEHEPKQDICEIIAVKHNQTEANGDKANKVLDASIKQSDRSVSSIMFKEDLVTDGAGKNTDIEVNQDVIKAQRDIAIIEKIKSKSPELFTKYDSPDERVEAALENAGTAKPYNGDLMMNPRMYMTYNAEEEDAVGTMISDILVPPYDPSLPMDSSMNESIVYDVLNINLHYSFVHDILTDNAKTRTQLLGGISEMDEQDRMDKTYFREKGSSLFHKMGNNLDEYTPTKLSREQAIMQAYQIHMSLKEYKNNLKKEIMLAQNILLKLEEN